MKDVEPSILAQAASSGTTERETTVKRKETEIADFLEFFKNLVNRKTRVDQDSIQGIKDKLSRCMREKFETHPLFFTTAQCILTQLKNSKWGGNDAKIYEKIRDLLRLFYTTDAEENPKEFISNLQKELESIIDSIDEAVTEVHNT